MRGIGKQQLKARPHQSPAVTALPKGESLAKPVTLCGLPRPLPLGEVDLRSKDGEGEPAAPQRRAFAESGAANAVSLYDPFRENSVWSAPQSATNAKL